MFMTTRRLRPGALAGLGLIVAGAAPLVATAPAHASSGHVFTVNPGGSIQSTIDRAAPGDTVIVKPGIYREQLVIRTDDVRLVGIGAELRTPATTAIGPCDPAGGSPFPPLPGAQVPVGICVSGSFAPDGSVADAATDVSITGIKTTGFGVGIAAQGTARLRLTGTTTQGSSGLGTVVSFSTGAAVTASASNDNLDSAFAFLGDDGLRITASRASGNRGEGIVLINSTGGAITGNALRGNCSGVSVVGLGAPTGSSTIALNLIEANNNLCLRTPDVNPQFAGIGVLLAGASRTVVTANDIRDHRFAGDVDLPSGGVVVVSTAAFGGGPAMNDRIIGNRLVGNAPDLFDDGTGTNIAFSANACTISVPAGIC